MHSKAYRNLLAEIRPGCIKTLCEVHKEKFCRLTEKSKFTVTVWRSVWSLSHQVSVYIGFQLSGGSQYCIPSLEGTALCAEDSRLP